MKYIGIADTTFARYDMAKDVIAILSQYPGKVQWFRYTVPGIKDLPIAALKLFRDKDCHLVLALGMPGPTVKDKASTQIASEGLMQVQLKIEKHILEVFVHEDEATTPEELRSIMQDRASKHAQNAVDLLFNQSRLTRRAGQGIRQGYSDAGPI